METVNAVGRRKTAVARVYLSEGKGNITVNKKSLEEYFPLATLQYVVKQPLELLGVMGQYDIKVNVAGGGFNGQAEALRLGIARALVKVNAEDKTKLIPVRLSVRNRVVLVHVRDSNSLNVKRSLVSKLAGLHDWATRQLSKLKNVNLLRKRRLCQILLLKNY